MDDLLHLLPAGEAMSQLPASLAPPPAPLNSLAPFSSSLSTIDISSRDLCFHCTPRSQLSAGTYSDSLSPRTHVGAPCFFEELGISSLQSDEFEAASLQECESAIYRRSESPSLEGIESSPYSLKDETLCDSSDPLNAFPKCQWESTCQYAPVCRCDQYICLSRIGPSPDLESPELLNLAVSQSPVSERADHHLIGHRSPESCPFRSLDPRGQQQLQGSPLPKGLLSESSLSSPKKNNSIITGIGKPSGKENILIAKGRMLHNEACRPLQKAALSKVQNPQLPCPRRGHAQKRVVKTTVDPSGWLSPRAGKQNFRAKPRQILLDGWLAKQK